MSGGRKKGETLNGITPQDRLVWFSGIPVWYPNGASGWIAGQVVGYTTKFIRLTTTRGDRRAVPSKLRLRDNNTPPTESAY